MDPKERFSDRVDDYVRYRPGYPRPLLELIVRQTGLSEGHVAADIGAGTGILTAVLLESGARVIAVEPNAAMRAAAESALSGVARFESVAASAEDTGLPAASVDVVAAAQAFHWFDAVRARVEFSRILKPGGWVVLVWNLRKKTPFLVDYEDLLARFAPGYGDVRMAEHAAEPNVRAFFAPEVPVRTTFDHEQVLDESALQGRLFSASYAPRRGEPGHEPMLLRLTEIFHAHAREGVVRFAYETVVYCGHLAFR